MGQTRHDDTRTELSRPGEPGLTTRMVEKGIQHQQQVASWRMLTSSHMLLNISYIMVMISIAFSFISYTTILPTQYNLICRV